MNASRVRPFPRDKNLPYIIEQENSGYNMIMTEINSDILEAVEVNLQP